MRAGKFALRQAVLHYLHRYVLRQDFIQTAGTFLPSITGNGRGLLFLAFNLKMQLRLVKEHIHLPGQFFVALFRGRAESLFPGKAHLFHEPIHLLAQTLVFFAEGINFRA